MARENKRGLFGAGSQHGESSADSADDSGPLDIAAVRRDDALIDAIAGDGTVATESIDEYQLATLLAGWRAELVTPELPDIDLDAIVAAVNQEVGARNARVRSGGRLRLVRPIVGAAAAIAVVVGVTTAFSYNAEPGDPLWKVKEVVFSDQADSTVANIDTVADLQEAEQLISDGKPEQAQVLLERAETRASDVNDESQREDLLTTLQKLVDEAQKAIPALPPVSLPLPTPATTQVSGSQQSSAAATSAAQSTTAPETTEPQAPVTTDPTVVSTTETTEPAQTTTTQAPVETTEPTQGPDSTSAVEEPTAGPETTTPAG